MDLVSIVVSLAQYKQFEITIRQSELHHVVATSHEVIFFPYLREPIDVN